MIGIKKIRFPVKKLVYGLTGVLLVGVSLGAYAAMLQITGNFHSIVPGEMYRSAQPDARQFKSYHSLHGIRTVINLRGAHPKAGWYQDEVATVRELGMTHIDYRMSEAEGLTVTQAEELIEILRKAEKPVLIHCKAGADRTGLVSALYLAALKGEKEGIAEGQISFRYGHVSIPGTAAYPIDVSWEKMEPWLGFRDS